MIENYFSCVCLLQRLAGELRPVIIYKSSSNLFSRDEDTLLCFLEIKLLIGSLLDIVNKFAISIFSLEMHYKALLIVKYLVLNLRRLHWLN